MGWRLEDLLGLPVEYYEVLIEVAEKWLGGGGEE